jgi:hypothetical protein
MNIVIASTIFGYLLLTAHINYVPYIIVEISKNTINITKLGEY